MIEAHNLIKIPDIRHGFFTRQGGISEGIYATLNCGYGSDDDAKDISNNRAHVATALGLNPEDLITAYQVHSADIVMVDKPWDAKSAPKVDGMVTNKSGIALGILTADCAPILFGDEQAGIIGAAHAGWRGALGGVAQAVISAMSELGASPSTITAAIGPAISATAYEVGPELREAFLEQSQDNDIYFTPSERPDHFMFNLPGYLEDILNQAGLKSVEVIDACTYKSEQKFFSYRRTTHQKQADYGRQISAITLGPAEFLKQ